MYGSQGGADHGRRAAQATDRERYPGGLASEGADDGTGSGAGSRRFAEAEAEAGGDFAVAWDAKRAEVVEVALAAALDDREYVIRVPERTAAGDGFHPIEREAGDAGFAGGSFQGRVDRDGIGLAKLADASVAGEYLVTKVTGVGAQTPLVDAEVGTESATASGEDFKFAPTAERQAVRSDRELVALGAAAGECAGQRHRSLG